MCYFAPLCFILIINLVHFFDFEFCLFWQFPHFPCLALKNIYFANFLFIVFSPRSKKRPAPIPMELEDDSATPNSKSIKIEEPQNSSFTPKRIMAPPEVPNVQIRAKLNKKINKSTSAWKTLSLSRRDKVKSLNSDSSQIFRSPSIYENQELQEQNHTAVKNHFWVKIFSKKIFNTNVRNLNFRAKNIFVIFVNVWILAQKYLYDFLKYLKFSAKNILILFYFSNFWNFSAWIFLLKLLIFEF